LNLANLSKPQFFTCSAPGFGCGTVTGDPAFIVAAFTRSGADFDESAWVAATAESEVAAVPEPSTWAMMLAGFAGLGWLARTRGRKTSPA
jgi:hypothetical protein